MNDEQSHHQRLTNALLVIRQLRERAESLERAASEPIAIIGLGCRFPGAVDPEAFWQLLHNGGDAVREVPADRWNIDDIYDPDPEAPGKMYTRCAGFLDEIALFDPQFFGIAPREATSMDPQQRLLLEVSWEALEQAGIAADRLVQSRTGVFVGLMNFDFAYLQAARGASSIDAYLNSGVAPSIAAGRLSYVMGLQGPCMTVDTACSSSLVTVHLACQSLRAGECDLALAGGVNAILTPGVMLGECKARMLSPDGRCKTFDASADGFGRGEGCGMVVLKRLSDAQRDGDPVLALIRGSAVNQDGNSQGLTAPNGPSQQRVIRQALARGNLKPDAVQYVETHGTGTQLGDPIEVQALAAVYGAGRSADRPLWIGSVKTNVGHLEGAAGVASLIKVVLALQREEIPAHLHFRNPTPHVSWDRLPLKVAAERVPWPRGKEPRTAGVSAFGFSGTNAHVVLEEVPLRAARTVEVDGAASLPERAWHVLALSAKSRAALEQLTRNYAIRLVEHSQVDIADVCFTANTGRSYFEQRTALVVSSREEAVARLASWTPGECGTDVWHGTARVRPKMAWVLTGDCVACAGMVRELLATQPVFRAELERCADLLAGQWPHSLLKVLQDEEPWRQPSQFMPPACFALQVALAELCRSWGIVPDVVLGLGLGEYAAACLAGALSLEEGLTSVLKLARPIPGVSAAESTSTFYAPLTQKAVEHVLINGSSGAVVEPAQHVPTAWWQTPTQQIVADAPCAQALLEQGCGLLIASSGLDAGLAAIMRAWPAQAALPAVLPLLRPGQRDAKPLAEALAQLFVRGISPDFEAVDKPWSRRKLALPTYPFQRQRFWPSPSSSYRQTWDEETAEHPLWGRRQTLASGADVYERAVSVRVQPYFGDHRVFDQVVMPGAWYVAGALATASVPTALRDVRFVQALVLREDETRRVQTVVGAPAAEGARRFQVFSAVGKGLWTLHAEGELHDAPLFATGPTEALATWQTGLRSQSPGDWYTGLRSRGLAYGESFHCLQGLWVGAGEAVGVLALPDCVIDGRGLALHPMLLDGCFQVVAAALPANTDGTYVPVRIDNVELHGTVGERLHCRARLRSMSGSEELTADLQLVDDAGRPMGSIAGLALQRVSREALLAGGRAGLSQWFYEVTWREQAHSERASTTDFLPEPVELIDLSASATIAWAQATGGVSYDELPKALEAASAQFALQALARLGWQLTLGEHVTATDLLGRLGLTEKRERFVRRLLELLSAQGWLRRAGADWVVERLPPTVEPQRHMTGLMERFPAYRPELGLLDRCGKRLAEYLRGEIDPLALLFPTDEMSNARQVYGESPAARVFNGLLSQVLARVGARLPDGRRLRVLEIGAGTGSTTAALLPLLPADRTDYLFTDLSAGFFAAAEERFADYSFVSYQALDIERDPQALVSAGHVYDVVVAANVLHATRDVARSLAHVRSLLAPGGLLVLLEGFGRQGWLDLTFGLLPGWWQFADAWRTDYPLLTGETWCALLKAQGFQGAEVLAPAAEELMYGVIAARAPQGESVPAPAGTWLIFQDAAGLGARLGEALRQRGQRCVGIDYGQAYAFSPAHCVLPGDDAPVACERLLEDVLVNEAPLAGIVHLWNLDVGQADTNANQAAHGDQGAAHGCGSVLHLVQALVRRQLRPARGLWLVTRGAQAITPGEWVAAPGQALVWGLGKVIALEHPELNCRRLDLDPASDATELEYMLAELLTGDTEEEIALRQGIRRVSRLSRWPPPGRLPVPDGEYQLQIAARGNLDQLRLEPRVPRPPGPGEVALRVRAAGLNFRDVLNALGMYPGDAGPLGGECSGEVIALGEGVSSVQVGDPVLALAAGTMASRVVAPAALVAPKPASLTYAQAAGVPIAFCTAALAWARAGLRAGERVLIHAASGGVGLAALQLAQRLGAEVVATASPTKQDYLRALGVRHVFNSRTTEFAEKVREATGGRGVDVVLNSLTSGDFIAATVRTLSNGGRFVEIGKRDIWSSAQMAATRADVRYEILALDDLLRETPAAIGGVLSEVAAGFERGELRPLSQVVYPLAEAATAFRLMQQAGHIGKIVLRLPALVESFNGQGTYLITGGLGGLGLATARWLFERGARHLGLLSRRPPDPAAETAISEFRAAGCNVQVLQADVSRETELRRALAELAATQPPLRGVIHAAGVLDDGALVNLNWTRFSRVLAAKVEGAWHLHRLTRDQDLDFFVLYSSMTSVLGSAGQANHTAANAFLDGLAHARRAAGLPGQSINWGAWAEIGSVAGPEVAAQLRRRGIATIAPEAGLAATEHLLRTDAVQVGVLPVDWERFRTHLGDRPAPFYAEMLTRRAVVKTAVPRSPTTTLRRRLELALPDERLKMLRRHLEAELARVLRLDPTRRVDPGLGFFDMGMDSLMAVELRNRLQADCELERPLASTALFDFPTLDALAEHLSQQLPMIERKAQPESQVQPDDVHARRVVDEIKHLSEAETATEIARELANLVEGAANE